MNSSSCGADDSGEAQGLEIGGATISDKDSVVVEGQLLVVGIYVRHSVVSSCERRLSPFAKPLGVKRTARSKSVHRTHVNWRELVVFRASLVGSFP